MVRSNHWLSPTVPEPPAVTTPNIAPQHRRLSNHCCGMRNKFKVGNGRSASLCVEVSPQPILGSRFALAERSLVVARVHTGWTSQASGAPKNVGTSRLLFNGPGRSADRDSTLESFLANEVEGPAAKAMQEVCGWPSGSGGDLPPALTRYLGWAAARSLPMRTLMNVWAERGIGRNGKLVESPPDGLVQASESAPRCRNAASNAWMSRISGGE